MDEGKFLMGRPPLLELCNLGKSYGSVPALQSLSCVVSPGEVVGLVGENGAGKSTLIRLISGVIQPTAGQILWSGAAVRFDSPAAALASGIATIHQELESCAHLSVAENMLLGEAWPRGRWRRVAWASLVREASRRLREFDLDIDPRRPMHQLTPAEQQEVAIAAALARDAQLLILDEPTASLTEMEASRLCARLRRSRDMGRSVIYVSHRLDEVMTVSDRIVVLRDGRKTSDVPKSETSIPQVVEAMLGSIPLPERRTSPKRSAAGSSGFRMHGASRAGLFQDVSLEIACGEIVGLGGLLGAGRSELARAIYGLYPLSSGRMELDGQPWAPRSPQQALNRGVVYLPEERKRQGLVLEHSVLSSVGICLASRVSRWGWIRRTPERQAVQAVLDQYTVRVQSLEQSVGTLSGGNQQKLLLGRWLERDPQFVILDEPTRGVDVAAKSQIHSLIQDLAARGKLVLLISSDLPELVSLSDRIVILNRGTAVGTLSGSEKTEHAVLMAAAARQPACLETSAAVDPA